MEYVKKYKNILIGVAIFLVLGGGYLYWQGQNPSVDVSTLSVTGGTPTNDASFAGQQILAVLNQLKRISIDGSVFESPVFKSLIDYTIATTSEPVGRPDPFAPI